LDYVHFRNSFNGDCNEAFYFAFFLLLAIAGLPAASRR
jgi:hypothetical protein